MKNQTIAVLGGTGKAGKYIVKALLTEGYHLNLLVRDQDLYVDGPAINLIEGDARDYEVIHQLLNGCDTVISAVGQRPGETGVFSQSTANILKAMEAHGIKRYISLTGLNVDAPDDEKGAAAAFGTAWMKEHYPLSTADKQVEFELLNKSLISWTLIRLPMIHLTDDKTQINISLTDCPGDHINAADLAQFIIRLVMGTEYRQAAPFIASS